MTTEANTTLLIDVITEILCVKAGASLSFGEMTPAPCATLDDVRKHPRAPKNVHGLIDLDLFLSKGIEYYHLRSGTFRFTRDRWDALRKWRGG